MTEAGRAERDRVDREQWLGRFPGGIPPYPTTTPEEEAHWAKCESVRQKLGHTNIHSPYSVVRGFLPLPASLSEAETEAKGLFLPEVTV